MSQPFPFFVGANGSGTTLHRAIFDSHPDMAIPGESRFIVDLAGNRGRYETAQGFDSERFLSDLAAHKRFGNWGLPVERVEATLSSTGVDDYPEAIRCVYRAYAESQGKTRYGDKTQSYVHDLIFLAELFPEARVVHAVRDGRNVALAHAKGKRIEQVGVSWSRRVMAGRRAGTALGPDRYLESRYVDLIDDPEGAVRRICDFLDLTFDPVMLEYYERAESVISTTAVPDRHLDIYKPPTKGLQDWKRDLSESQIARFEAIAGHALEALEYKRAFTKLPLGKRISAWAHLGADVAKITAKRLAKRIGLG